MILKEVYLGKLLHQAWNRDLSFPYRNPLKLKAPPYEGQGEAPLVGWLQALDSEQYCKGIPSHVRTNERGKHPIFLGQEAFWSVIFQNVSSLHHDNQVCRQNGMDSVLCEQTLKKKKEQEYLLWIWTHGSKQWIWTLHRLVMHGYFFTLGMPRNTLFMY